MNTKQTAVIGEGYRYQSVANAYARTRETVMAYGDITQSDYAEMEFATGVALLDAYFNENIEHAIMAYRDQLLKDQQIGYWSWLCINRQQMEFHWWNTYSFKHQVEVGVFNARQAAILLKQHWQQAHDRWIHNPETHDRLRFWLVKNQQFTI